MSDNKIVIGNVVSNKMDKTAVVAVVTKVPHPVYGKFVKKTTKYYVHDEKNELGNGDVVRIQMSRPISKQKAWVLHEVISKQAV